MSNLPPGVSESMIPGNRPEDIRAEKLTDELYAFVAERGVNFDVLPDDGYDLFDRAVELLFDLIEKHRTE